LKTGKKVLDQNKYVAAILMDLSKAFDLKITIFFYKIENIVSKDFRKVRAKY
jgi:hypothetical protein